MSIKRLTDSIRLNEGNRFFILYGPGISDIYYPEVQQEFNLEQAVWQFLKEQNFVRVVLFSPNHQVYYYDAEFA